MELSGIAVLNLRYQFNCPRWACPQWIGRRGSPALRPDDYCICYSKLMQHSYWECEGGGAGSEGGGAGSERGWGSLSDP